MLLLGCCDSLWKNFCIERKKMIKEAVSDYLSAVHKTAVNGDAPTERYYPLLKEFIKELWKIRKEGEGEPEIIITRKKKEAGSPDIVIRYGSKVVGYIEARNPIKDLDDLRDIPLIRRYRKIYPNIILTNFLEFRLYRFGELTESVSIGRQYMMVTFGTKPVPENEEKCLELFRKYFSFNFPDNRNAREVAKELAKRTRFMRDMVVMKELQDEPVGDRINHIYGFYNAFKTYLIHGLTKEGFADLYSQTITFGLFTAAAHCREEFDRKKAIDHIPHSNGILHDVFEFVSMGALPEQLERTIDDIVDLLNSVDIGRILKEYFSYNKGADPILHFYETFLSEYDPRLRERRGVYYTPGAVVSFIVRSIHILLKKKLNRPYGLADPGIKILDPAAGTAAFLVEVARVATKEYVEKCGEGAKKTFLRDFLLNNLYGFELMMAPYAVAHLKMGYILDEMGGGETLKAGERFNIYVTDSLEMEDIMQSDLPGMSSLSAESRRAGKIKKETPINVILANPPYSGHSLAKSETSIRKTTKTQKTKYVKVKTWIGEKIEDYKRIDNKPLGEKNPKWLQDDYVKFIRFVQSKIDENGEGLVGVITNHGYLDNPTFRGMRRSLMQSFDEIYILDLHGNALRREKCPDGSRDENVFDIRQGVAIALFEKKKGGKEKKECRVFYADLWGPRDDKYKLLYLEDADTFPWQEIFPGAEFYLFRPRKQKEAAALSTYSYGKFYKVTDIFPVHSVGIVTARDKLTIKYRKDEVLQTINAFSGATEEDARRAHQLGDDTRDWTVRQAKRDLMESGLKSDYVVPILYRPFDIRYTYYTGRSRGFLCMPRPDVMKHMLRGNVGLVTVRQVAEGIFNHCLAADTIVDSRTTTSNKGIGYLFPLYLYPYAGPGKGKQDLFSLPGEPVRVQANINPKIFELLEQKAGFKPVPTAEQVFYYIYALLFSTHYREEYAEELTIDFPRIPFTADYGLFIEMGKLGERLAAVHLVKSPELNHTFSKFEVGNSNRVTRVCYVPLENRIYINSTQFFSNITRDIWEYRMGGYQVMAKWLKSRKGQYLNFKDIEHYIKIARILQLTLQYQEQIDLLYPAIEKRLIW